MNAGFAAALVTVAVLVVALALIAAVTLLLRMRQQSQLKERVAPSAGPGDASFGDAGGGQLLRTFALRGKALEGWIDTDQESTRLLVQAGWRSADARLYWYAFQAVLPAMVVVLLLVLWFFGPKSLHSPLNVLMFLFAGGALAFLVPRWVLRGSAAGRRQRIKNEVPLFIHLLVLLFEAGLSLRQAFSSMVREGRGVLPQLGREFEVVLRQMEAGGDGAEILKNLGDALEVDDLTSVLSVLRQIDRYGGEIRAPLLEVLAVLEQRRTLDLREQVNLLSGRMTLVMVLFFFPALLVFVAGPAFLSIIRTLAAVNGH